MPNGDDDNFVGRLIRHVIDAVGIPPRDYLSYTFLFLLAPKSGNSERFCND
jgi:hypothetical protein